MNRIEYFYDINAQREWDRLERCLLWTFLGVGVHLVWPRDLVGLPLVPAVLLFLLAALLAGTHDRWMPAVSASSAGTRAGLALAVVAGLSLLLYPALVHFGEKEQRHLGGEMSGAARQQAHRG